MPPTANDQIRDQLKATREQLSDARDRLAAAKKDVDKSKEAWNDSGKELTDLEAPERKAVQDAVQTRGEIQDEIAVLQQAENEALGWLGEPAQEPDHVKRARGEDPARQAQVISGQELLSREGSPYKAALEGGVFSSRQRFGSMNLGEVCDRETAASFFGSPSAAPLDRTVFSDSMQSVDRRGLQPLRLRPITLLDLFATGTTDSNMIEYVQVTTIPTGAVETAEGALKPELGALGTEDATAPVRTIAGWVKLLRQSLDDIAALGSLINQLLPYEVRRRIEAQMLTGDGLGQNLRGIYNTTGLGAPEYVPGDNPADALLRAMTTVILSDADPNFAAVNPLLWQQLLLLREVGQANDPTREGQYIFGSPASMASPTVWGMTLTTSRVIPEDQPLVGDSNGATLLVREGVNIRVSDADQDDFVKNRVTVLCEARVAFPVWRPASFAIADFTAES